MRFFNKLTAFAALSILFASQAQALDVTVNSATCNFFTFTITVNPVDYQLADYATFYVANAAALDTDYAKVSYSIKSTGDITSSNYPFTFNADIPGTAPGGSQWRIGVALDDSNGNVLTYSGAEAWSYIANPCGSSTTSTPTPGPSTTPSYISTSTSSSTTTTTPIRPDPTTPIPTPTHTDKPTHVSIPAIAGGIIGAVALFVALGLFLCLRKRKAAQQALHQQNRSVDIVEKGYVSNDPIQSVNTLSRSGHNSNLSDFIAKDESRTSSVPPMSPRSSQWNASNVGPMSPTLSATSAPSRANNPLTNSNIGSWTTNVNTTSGQENQFGDLPEPMSRR